MPFRTPGLKSNCTKQRYNMANVPLSTAYHFVTTDSKSPPERVRMRKSCDSQICLAHAHPGCGGEYPLLRGRQVITCPLRCAFQGDVIEFCTAWNWKSISAQKGRSLLSLNGRSLSLSFNWSKRRNYRNLVLVQYIPWSHGTRKQALSFAIAMRRWWQATTETGFWSNRNITLQCRSLLKGAEI